VADAEDGYRVISVLCRSSLRTAVAWDGKDPATRGKSQSRHSSIAGGSGPSVLIVLRARRLDERLLVQLDDESGAAVDAQLHVDRMQVQLHGPLGDPEALGDLPVAKALGHGADHLHLAAAEDRRDLFDAASRRTSLSMASPTATSSNHCRPA
jgi:hypothetical protein